MDVPSRGTLVPEQWATDMLDQIRQTIREFQSERRRRVRERMVRALGLDPSICACRVSTGGSTNDERGK